MAGGRRVRVERRHTDGPAYGHNARGSHRRQPYGADLLRRVHERRGQPRLRPLLRLYVPVHRLDGRTRTGIQHHPDFRVLGTGRAMLIPAHRLLVRTHIRGECGKEGIHSYPRGRLRLPARYPVPVHQPGPVGNRRIERPGRHRSLQGRRTRPRIRRGRHLGCRRHIRRSHRKVWAVPTAHLASRRYGRPDACECAYSRRDNGGGGSVPGRAGSSPYSRHPAR